MKKAQKGANLQLKNISKERDSIERILPKVKKLSDRINKDKSKMPAGLDKKQTGGSIGARGAASRMKSGGSVKKK